MLAGTKRFVAVMAGVIGLALLGTAFSVSASAAPYTIQPTISISTQTPAAGGTLTISGAGFGANEDVRNELRATTYPLASAQTDANGAFRVTVTLPAGVTGAHTIVATGVRSGKSASAPIMIGAASSNSGVSRVVTGGGASGASGLASTGVAALGIAGLGAGLIIGGGLLLLTTVRRRQTAVSAV